MRAYLAHKPKGKFGVHRYPPEDWGFTGPVAAPVHGPRATSSGNASAVTRFTAQSLRQSMAPHINHFNVTHAH